MNDNRVCKVTLLLIPELYGILFNVKEIWFVLEWFNKKAHGDLKCIDTYRQNHVHIYFIYISCKSVIDNYVYMELNVLPIHFLSEQSTFCICLESIP